MQNLIKLLVRFVVTLALLVWVIGKVDLQQFHETLKTARWEFLIAIWLMAMIFFCIASIKMQLILRKQGCDVNLATLLGTSAITSFYSMVMPGSLSTAVKWYILKKDTGKGIHVFSGMIYNQLSEIVVMMLLGLTTLMVTNPTSILLPDVKNQWLLPVGCGILISAIIFVCLLVLDGRIAAKSIEWLRCLVRHFPVKIRQRSEEILEQIAIFHTVTFRFHLVVGLLTLAASFVGGVVIYMLSAKGANIAVPIGVFIWLPTVIYILGRIPITIANLGVREVTLVWVLAGYGVEKSSALLMSMLIFSVHIILAAIGASWLIAWAITGKKETA